MKSVKVHGKVRRLPIGYAADITSPTYPVGIKGCPMGRGSTPQAAIEDLKRRVREESGVEPVGPFDMGYAGDVSDFENKGFRFEHLPPHEGQTPARHTVYVDGPGGQGDSCSVIEITGPDCEAIAALILTLQTNERP